MWSLDLAPLLNADGKVVWERVARKGQSPSERSGSVMMLYRNRGVTFGGVFDGDNLSEKTAAYDGKAKEKKAKALFFNDLHTFDIENKRWFELPVLGKKNNATTGRRRKKIKETTNGDPCDEDDDDVAADEIDERMGVSDGSAGEPWMSNGAIFGYTNTGSRAEELPELEVKLLAEGFEWMLEDEGDVVPWWAGGANERAWYAGDPWVFGVIKITAQDSLLSMPSATTKLSVRSIASDFLGPTPLGRLNPSLLLLGHTLVVYGGTFESDSREWALDDAWSIDLRDREGWKCLMHGTPHDFDSAEKGDSNSESSDSEEEGGSSDDEESDDEVSKEAAAENTQSEDESQLEAEKKSKTPKKKAISVQDEIAQWQASLEIDNAAITPVSGEALRDFFARTVS
jgi:hypothetical protein